MAMTFTVRLIDPVSGKRGEIGHTDPNRYNDEAKELAGIHFYWTEGNMACDCNRWHIVDPDAEIKGIRREDCGQRILIEELVLEDGRVLIKDNECLATYRDGRIIEFAGRIYD